MLLPILCRWDAQLAFEVWKGVVTAASAAGLTLTACCQYLVASLVLSAQPQFSPFRVLETQPEPRRLTVHPAPQALPCCKQCHKCTTVSLLA
eukprot:1161442-Pelagomonas_calceolata.AAC.13